LIQSYANQIELQAWEEAIVTYNCSQPEATTCPADKCNILLDFWLPLQAHAACKVCYPCLHQNFLVWCDEMLSILARSLLKRASARLFVEGSWFSAATQRTSSCGEHSCSPCATHAAVCRPHASYASCSEQRLSILLCHFKQQSQQATLLLAHMCSPVYILQTTPCRPHHAVHVMQATSCRPHHAGHKLQAISCSPAHIIQARCRQGQALHTHCATQQPGRPKD